MDVTWASFRTILLDSDTLVSRGTFFFAIEISVNNIDAIQKERIYETVDNLQN